MKETELFGPVKQFLENKGYEVYAEVEAPYSWNRADVVGRNKAREICVVEMKTSLTFKLLDQIINWEKSANYLYIAIPYRKEAIPKVVRTVCKMYGIGIIYVFDNGATRNIYKYPRTDTHEVVEPVRSAITGRIDWNQILVPEHKTWVEGGSNSGGHVTPYKLTIKKIREFLESRKDWTTTKDIIEVCDTHYSNPKTAVSKVLQSYESEWCECKKERNKLYFRAKEKKK